VRDSNFRFWIRKTFILSKIGDHDILCEKLTTAANNIGLPVAIKENMYKVCVDAHITCQHSARDPTYNQVKSKHSFIPKALVALFVKACARCALHKTKLLSTTAAKPIVSEGFLHRLQVHISQKQAYIFSIAM
ncbi:hypothetical protein BDB00DRAFT_776093, partial [Zychaea mexicana]|uniref:uncharacterized protein n=1 Tax=Zychaea mexicana TaxID=64656 RepID=UPI0022FE5752